MNVLVVNAGSSSLKLRLLDSDDAVVASKDLPAPGPDRDADDLHRFLQTLENVPDAVGHRIVHGGDLYSKAVIVDEEVRSNLDRLTALAPLHQPGSLAALDAVSAALPSLPAVACFDTAFHHDMPAESTTYALPSEWREKWGLRRFGFHGLSHCYAARRACNLLERDEDKFRVVTCHLGSGASLAAVANGKSVDTTMGFTPLEGLVMASRSGTVDPGMLLWLQSNAGISHEELSEALEHRSGLQGLAGASDMREILAAADDGDARAILAVDVYVHRLKGGIAAMAASMGGLDAVVFTGGVGEHSPEIRSRATEGLDFLGIGIDDGLNRSAIEDCDISSRSASVSTLVIYSREEVQIAREVRELCSS